MNKEIYIPIYDVKIFIEDIKESKKREDSYDACVYNNLDTDNSLTISFKKYNVGLLIHELHHCVELIFQFIEEDGLCLEPKAYLMEYLYNEFIKIKKDLILK